LTEITNDHLKLLEKAYWKYEDCEYGAPAIDCKRPYGNSDVEEDIAEILGWREGSNGLSEKQTDKAHDLHHELLDVIEEIIKDFTNAWRKSNPVIPECKHDTLIRPDICYDDEEYVCKKCGEEVNADRNR